jgi:subtilisin family serine protease|tara:strand:+ start:957 stop:3137 length:2181 start_codon:yes stop_codon:yes gene_type:complete
MKSFLPLLFILISMSGISQIRINSESHENIQRLISQSKEKTHLELKSDNPLLPIYKVNGELCLSTLAKVSPNFNVSDLNDKAFIGSRVADIITLKIPLKNLTEINNFANIIQLNVAEKIIPHNNRMTADVRADSVWEGVNLPQAYTGKNVLIGITDWGFDYDNPMFMDTSLTTSRVRAAWDHFKHAGNQPTGFGYGVEYVTPTELDDANSDTAGDYYDYATHGNHVAGIAGGSGAGLKYRGVAFESQYLFNSIQLDAGAAIDAFVWMKGIAENDWKRLVVNMSWGLYYMGTMDGTSLVSQAIDSLSAQGVTFVTSGGNNGNDNFHIKKTFTSDSIRTRIGFYSYSANPSMWGQCISMWGEVANPFNSRVEVYNSSNQLVASSRYYNTNSDNGYHDTYLLVGTDSVFYNYSIDSAHPNNNRPHQRMRVKNTNTSLRVVLHSYATTGTVHYWNVVELSNGVGNWGLEFYAYGNDGVTGDNLYGLGEPACTESAITVAAHSPEVVAGNGTAFPGSIANFSSVGPTYDERSKPDVSAPGVGIISSINSYTTRSYTSAASTTFNGRTYHFSAFSGTSMSSPATAGVVALLLEASPTLEPRQIRDILRNTAREDTRTGVLPANGSPVWGHGKVTVTAAIQSALTTVSVGETELKPLNITLFPNPTNGTFTLDLGEQTQLNRIFITDINGRLIKEITPQNAAQYEVNFDGAPGIYLLNVVGENERATLKIIKE